MIHEYIQYNSYRTYNSNFYPTYRTTAALQPQALCVNLDLIDEVITIILLLKQKLFENTIFCVKNNNNNNIDGHSTSAVKINVSYYAGSLCTELVYTGSILCSMPYSQGILNF